jgi:hypothetical protein
MKNKLLDYILLEADVYKRPLRKRYILMLLCCGAGFVIMMNYAAKNGFGFLNNAYSIIMTIVLVFFCGIFSMVVFSWPATDMSASVGKSSGKIGITVKRMKIAKGFLFAVIYTGAISALLKMLFNYVFDFNSASIAAIIITIAASLWAGAMMTRCITTVFEETEPKKLMVFILSSVWLYVIIGQIMGFIIKSAYSIIL